ncbi:MAG TPA: efflux RND transporter periplasmic adaptor subunit, partial [Anaerolineales bacterium]|nr:efflux RND transporter periplasmic adaptor subunit [Anaerolineales bacterium]
MKARLLSQFILASLLFAACSPAGTPASEATPLPTVIADEALIAEGRVEPIRYAEIAFNAGGSVGEVLVHEGEQVKKGQPLIRL